MNLIIDKDTLLKASPLSDAGFGYIWAGVRGTHGYTKGHLVYQVKVSQKLDLTSLRLISNMGISVNVYRWSYE